MYCCFLIIRPLPRMTRNDSLIPYTRLCLSGLARSLGPALAEFDAARADALVRSLVVLAFDGSDRCLDAERESADFAVVDAILVAGEAADLCHVKTPDACLEGHPMRPRWQSIRRLMGAAHRQAGAVAEDGPKPSRSEEHTSDLQSLMRLS